MVALQLRNAGAGYGGINSSLPITVAPPAAASSLAVGWRRSKFKAATAELVPEWEVASVAILEAGSGYNADEAPAVTIAPPPAKPSRGPAATAAAKARVHA